MRLVLIILLAIAASVLLAMLWAWVAAASLLTLGGVGTHLGAGIVGTILIIWGAVTLEKLIVRLSSSAPAPSAPDSAGQGRGPWDRPPP